MKLIIRGLGWNTSLNVRIHNKDVVINKNDFEKFLKILAYTHDIISGGFDYEFKEVMNNEK